MGDIGKRRGVLRALVGLFLAAALAACSHTPSEPAPVYMRGAAGGGWEGPPPDGSHTYAPPPRSYRAPSSYVPPRPSAPIAAMPIAPPSAPLASSPPPPSAEPGRAVVVERGQSLSRLAAHYHVSERAIIEANNLKPPYKIEIGQRLTIPGAETPPPGAQASLSSPPPSALSKQPDVIPLDGPAPPRTGAGGALSPPSAKAPPPSPPGERPVAQEAQIDAKRPAAPPLPPPPASPPPQQARGGRFPWPVRGSVVAGYGTGSSGAKNDGINIAAPLGTPVRAIEGGEVAYAGNELKGYGNLVLVKHADGWISAYAHCEELLVKKGDQVAGGQVIAKVGNSGGVGQPQLHFELRRGQRPVDPREFLGPSPSAAGEGGSQKRG